MGEKGEAFAKGGCGCLIAFAVFALIAVMLGGRARIDLGGAILLFVIGGVIGLNYGTGNKLLLYLGYETQEESQAAQTNKLAGRFTFIHNF